MTQTNATIETPDIDPDKLAQALLDFLTKTFGQSTMWEIIAPLLPIVIRLGATVGQQAAQDILAGLGGKASYPYWEQVIAAAIPEERIVIMDAANQAAIQDCLNRIAANKALADALKALLSVVVGVLAGLL